MVWIVRAKDDKGNIVFWSATDGGCVWRKSPSSNIATFYDKGTIRDQVAYLNDEGYKSGRVTDVQAVNLSAYHIG